MYLWLLSVIASMLLYLLQSDSTLQSAADIYILFSALMHISILPLVLVPIAL